MRRPEAGRVNPILDGVRAVLDARRERDTLPPLDGLRLDGRTVLLTGPSSGLGRVLAAELARRGARLILGCRAGLRSLETRYPNQRSQRSRFSNNSRGR